MLTPLTIIVGLLFIVFVIVMLILLRRKKTGLALVLLALAIAAGVYGYKEYNRGNRDMTKTKADTRISATGLIAAYISGDTLADQKYLGKVIEVEGNVKKIEKDESGFYTLVLGDTASLSSVRCSMDTIHQSDAAGLATGSSVTLRGICTGFKKNELLGVDLGSDVELNRCALIKK
jgi:hypothetical protein